MVSRTVLTTDRLVLRPVAPEDAPAVQALADDPVVAANVLTVRHPYTLEDAVRWIQTHREEQDRGEVMVRAITLRQSGAIVGAIGLHIDADNARAELGYWLGKDHRGVGYATEAGRAMLDHAFRALDLHRVYANHFPHNPGSGRLLEKLGMQREGRLRQHVRKDQAFEDLVVYGVLREEWEAASRR